MGSNVLRVSLLFVSDFEKRRGVLWVKSPLVSSPNPALGIFNLNLSLFWLIRYKSGFITA